MPFIEGSGGVRDGAGANEQRLPILTNSARIVRNDSGVNPTAQHLRIDHADFDVTGDLVLAAWSHWIDPELNVAARFITQGPSQVGSISYLLQQRQVSGVWQIQMIIRGTAGFMFVEWSLKDLVNILQWFHLCVQIDISEPDKTKARCFINGKNQGHGTVTISQEPTDIALAVAGDSGAFSIGATSTSFHGFNGYIKDVFVGDTLLPDDEVLALMFGGPQLSTRGIRDGWTFNGESLVSVKGKTIAAINGGPTFGAGV